jgi:heme/copper-type cytochrome/quinol oxidase subunit 3
MSSLCKQAILSLVIAANKLTHPFLGDGVRTERFRVSRYLIATIHCTHVTIGIVANVPLEVYAQATGEGK